MKITMTKIILIIAFVYSYSNVFSQSDAKNVIRIGAGVNFSNHLDNDDKYIVGGIALETEYQRSLSKYIGINVNFAITKTHYGKHYDYIKMFGSVGTIFTPFPDKFRWIKIGIGLSLQKEEDYWGIEREMQISDHLFYGYDQYFRYSGYRWGVHFPVRFYIIDNSKYELFVSSKIKTRFISGLEFDNVLLCLGFGVKF
jgi:hypothetical protein